MELKEFINRTINDISDGVFEGHGYMAEKKSGYIKEQSIKITFDVNITSDDTNTVEGSGKLVVANLISFGGSAENKTGITQYNRVQFSLEAHLDTGKFKKPAPISPL